MKSETNIQLGDVAKDSITGYKGVVVCKAEYLNGCIRVTLQSEELTKDGDPKDCHAFDVEQVKLVKAQVHERSAPGGGPCPGPAPRQEARRG